MILGLFFANLLNGEILDFLRGIDRSFELDFMVWLSEMLGLPILNLLSKNLGFFPLTSYTF